MLVDIQKSPQQNLLDLVNTDNPGLNLTLDQVSFGSPVALSGDASGKNTSVDITIVSGTQYFGTKTVKYDRLGATQGVATVPTQVTVVEGDTQAQAKAKVVAAFGLIASEVDVLDANHNTDIYLPTTGNPDTTGAIVVAKPGSLVYLDNSTTPTVYLTL